MARVKKPNPSASPMYPTSGRIHILFNELPMNFASLREVMSLTEPLGTRPGGRVLISPDFGAGKRRPQMPSPPKSLSGKTLFATTLKENLAYSTQQGCNREDRLEEVSRDCMK